MYEELVKMLRVCGDSNNSCGNRPILEDGSCPHGEWEFAAEKYMLEAADAIEELQKDLKRSKEYEAFWEKEANEALRKFQIGKKSPIGCRSLSRRRRKK